ncbi:MAG: cysteine-rich CWC family protein [Burkholderiaceae bacterium]|nr:cysteine-rich CWC family protein [Burkholderiaceae bacterium]MDZ4160371.1 cysteine-rich CWC family protein [Burkholderiales bacterium]
MTATTTPAPTACPLCGQPNLCAMELARLTGVPEAGPCWCTRVSFAPDLLARVPAQAQGKACICEACARQAAASPSLADTDGNAP